MTGPMKRPWVVLVAIAIGLAVGVGLYLWYPATPIYTLTQVRQAVRTHDWQAFTTRVDVDSVVDNVALDMAAIMREAMERKDLSKVLTKSLGALIAIKVRTSLHRELKDWVTGESSGRKGFLSSILPKNTGEVALHLKTVSWWGATARARVSLGADTTLVLELVKKDGVWRVARVLNVRELYEKSRARQSP